MFLTAGTRAGHHGGHLCGLCEQISHRSVILTCMGQIISTGRLGGIERHQIRSADGYCNQQQMQRG